MGPSGGGAARKAKAATGKGGGDDRFAAMHSDPRFRRFPKAGGKVEIDNRFATMFTDEVFQVRGAVDKRGRKVKASKSREDMRRYYRLSAEEEARAARKASGEADSEEEEDEPKTSAAKVTTKGKAGAGKPTGAAKGGEKGKVGGRQGAVRKVKEGSSSEEEEEDSEGGSRSDEEEGEEGGMDARAKELYLRARGLAGPDSSSDEEESEEEEEGEEKDGGRGVLDSDSGDEDQEDEGDEEEEGVEGESEDDPELQLERMKEHFGIGAVAALEAREQDVELVEDATHRVAVVDLDWRHVRAVDILSILQSFATKGRLKRVTVYPSDYGLERMRAEAEAGPQAIFKEGDGEAESEEESEGEEIDKEKLRFYERSRLRYYYAVAEFDSAAAASKVYEECDGLEFEHSSCKLDLRFIPDDMDFSQREVRDSADSVPAGYFAPMFQTKALKHTNVQLTWDADDVTRKKTLSRALTEDDVKEDDLKAFLASDDSDEDEGGDDEGAEQLRERYRSLLGLGGGGEGGGRGQQKEWRSKGAAEGDDAEAKDSDAEDSDDEEGKFRSKDEDTGMEMEVTFKPSLEELGDRLMAKKKEARKGGETVWEAYLRKKKEKRTAKKAGRKHADSDDEGDEDAVDPDIDDGLYTSGAAVGEADAFFEHDDDPFADPFFAGGGDAGEGEEAHECKGKRKSQQKAPKKKGSAKEERREEEGRDKAELELLLMDDESMMAATRGLAPGSVSGGPNGEATGPSKKLSRKERIRKKNSAKKLRARQDDSDDDEALGAQKGVEFEPDLGDSRFKALYSDPRFALDPTDPNFQRNKNTADFAKEVSKRRRGGASVAPVVAGDGNSGDVAAAGAAQGSSGGGGGDMRSMVANLKRKASKLDGSAKLDKKQTAEGASVGGATDKKRKKKRNKAGVAGK